MESSTAGPSSSIESSNSGPSTISSSGPAAVDSSRNEPEDSQEPGQKVDIQVVSLLSKLKSPRPSDFTRKRKIAIIRCAIHVCNCQKGHFVEKKKQA